jgi:alkylation response protein AidB-like acyl-CoA dehydrogenase
MDFDFSDEQRMLKDSVEQLITDRYDFEQSKKYMKEEIGYSRAQWAQYAEMGLLGLPFEERHGGVGGGPVETMIVMEAFGRGLVLEPYLATVVLGGGLVNLGGNDAERSASLPKSPMATFAGFAHSEAQSRYDLGDVATTASATPTAGYSMARKASSGMATAPTSWWFPPVFGRSHSREGIACFWSMPSRWRIAQKLRNPGWTARRADQAVGRKVPPMTPSATRRALP